MLKRILVSAFVAVTFVVIASTTASAQDTAIVTNNNNCLIPDGNRLVKVFKCTDGGIRYTIRNGIIKTSDNYCFDHGIPRGQNGGDRSVKLVRCHGGLSQTWWITKDGPGKGLIQNAVNPDVCLNISGGNDAPGGQLIVWPCGFNRPGNNEYFFIGARITPYQFSLQKPEVQTALSRGLTVTFNTGARMVAAGGGNMVAAGGGNMVAAGGGNMVAAGGGNLIGNDGSTIAAAALALAKGAGFRTSP